MPKQLDSFVKIDREKVLERHLIDQLEGMQFFITELAESKAKQVDDLVIEL